MKPFQPVIGQLLAWWSPQQAVEPLAGSPPQALRVNVYKEHLRPSILACMLGSLVWQPLIQQHSACSCLGAR